MKSVLIAGMAVAMMLILTGCATTPSNTGYTFDAKDWIQNPANGHYYRLTSKMYWPLARQSAEMVGGYLVTINDAAENAWLLKTFRPVDAVWIGMNDLRIEGQWEWLNGEPVTYTNWRAGQPGNSYNQQHSGTMHSIETEHPGQWNDEQADVWRQGIVERDSRRR